MNLKNRVYLSTFSNGNLIVSGKKKLIMKSNVRVALKLLALQLQMDKIKMTIIFKKLLGEINQQLSIYCLHLHSIKVCLMRLNLLVIELIYKILKKVQLLILDKH